MVRSDYGFKGTGLDVDAASAVLTDDAGGRWRFPVADSMQRSRGPWGVKQRFCREVCTERDLLNVCGTFYELPAENAGGFGMVRPIATHGCRIQDYCSYRGLLVLTGIDAEAKPSSHIIRSDDGHASLWVGVVDDLWAFGKPRGQGGPWKDTDVTADKPSDPYLITGFDKKRLMLSQNGCQAVDVTVELDITGTGVWRVFKTYTVKEDKPVHANLDDVRAYWLRVKASRNCHATAWLEYR